MSRPTDDELEDAAETGRCGCLLPDGDAIPGAGEDGDDE